MSGPQPIINERYRLGWATAFACPKKKVRATKKTPPKPMAGHRSRERKALDRRKGKG